MLKKISIAIDGPASAGKSTVAKILAKNLGYIYLDTGAMYRAVTLAIMNAELDFEDEEAIIALTNEQEITFKQLKDGQHVFLNEKDVTLEIRDNAVTNNVSKVASLKGVRELLVSRQQAIGVGGGIVMDGRDIGTAVLPNAEVKIFLIASVDERAERRYKENLEKGIATNLADLKIEIEKRDHMDMNRSVSPLVQAKDAILLDTTGLSIDEVVKKIEGIIK